MNAYVITRKDKLFFHFGILLPSGYVLHFASKTNNMFAGDQTVKKDPIEQFALQRKTEILYQIPIINEQELIKSAFSYWGKNEKYSLLRNNCITFIFWCLYNIQNCRFSLVLCYYINYILHNLLK